MPHRQRTVLLGRARLAGRVEVDKACMCGPNGWRAAHV